MASKKIDLTGTWHITEMENWGEDYFNMEVQAYIKIDKTNNGSFQFGLVTGHFFGEIEMQENGKKRLDFTWEGSDECDEASGSGWIEKKSISQVKGKIRLHGGDSSTFEATKKGFEGLEIFEMKDYEDRVVAIIEDESLKVTNKTLRKYLDFLKKYIELPLKVTGVDCFTFTIYKGRTPDASDKFEIIEFEEDIKNSSNLFVKVKRLSDEGGIFSLQLFEFEALDKRSIEYKILDDYSQWISQYL